MSSKMQFKRGTTSKITAYVPDVGEPIWDYEKESLFVGDGTNAGGIPVVSLDEILPSTTKGDIVVYDGSENINLAIGINEQILTADSAESSGMKWDDRDALDDITPATTKGDLIVFNNVGASSRLGIGSNDQVIAADSGENLGLKWVNRDFLYFDKAPSSNQTGNGIIVKGIQAGEILTVGQTVYFKSDGKAWKSKADDSATMPIMALSLEGLAAEATGDFLFQGFYRDDSWSWTVGGMLYGYDDTAGAMIQTQPSDVTDMVQVVGLAYSATIIYFNPNYAMVEV